MSQLHFVILFALCFCLLGPEQIFYVWFTIPNFGYNFVHGVNMNEMEAFFERTGFFELREGWAVLGDKEILKFWIVDGRY